MRWLDQLRMKIRMLFGRRNEGSRLTEELKFHLDRQIAENRAAGMSPDDARYAALRAFGNPDLLREQTRSTWSWTSVESFGQDVRYSVRTLLRTPGFSWMAVLVMALGIGANVALFTVVRSVLLKPLPFHDSERLVTLYESDSHHKGAAIHTKLPVDFGSAALWQSATRDRAEMAIVSPFQNYNVSAEGGLLPEKIRAAWSSWNFFSMLGVTPALGRSFSPQDDRPDATATALLANSFWMRRYNGDPAIVGKTIWLDAKPYTVIGVLPASFTFSSSFGGNTAQVWAPVKHEAPSWLITTFEDHEFLVVARLLHGTTLSALLQQLDAFQKQIQKIHATPPVHDGAAGMSMLDDAVEQYKTPLYALLAATGCVLLIACMNVASLLVARAAARRKDQAIRSALGGGRLRLLRERLMESLLLSGFGGLLGVTLAWAALQWLIHARADMNRIEAIHMDAVVAMFTAGVIAVCAVFSGAIAAMSSMSEDILSVLQESSRSHSGGKARAGLRRFLLALQVGLTVVLLIGAGLLLKSYQRLRNSDLGVPVDNVLTISVDLPEVRYKQPVQQVAFFEHLIEKVRAIPGVRSAGLVSTPPGEGWNGDGTMTAVEHPLPMRDLPDVAFRGAEPGYFPAIQIPLVRGRIFTADERLERDRVVVLSQLAARALFKDDDPIGEHIRSATGTKTYEVVGVVGDTRWNVSQPPMPTLYWPIYGNEYSSATIVVRSDRNVEALALPVQKVVGEMDSDLPVSDVMTLRQAIGKSTVDSAFDSMLVLAFAAIALSMAGAGLYGVLAYLVTQRTNEIGIRIALGAPRENVLRLMLADGLRPALIGLLVGLAASTGVVRQIRSMLYETPPLDPAVFGTVTATLVLVAIVACIVPAWRASRLDPMQALRTE
jgi:putative ABC transport system permease protein